MLYEKCKKIVKFSAAYGLGVALFFFLLSGKSWAFADQACLMQDFEVSITKSSKFLRFLMPTLTLKKTACELTVEYKRWRWAKTWIIDVCRGPVHIKYQNFSSAAWMKKASCYGQPKRDAFCRGYQQIMNLIEEDGLIYAPGERDDLSSDHGKTYCLYLLAKSYLDEGKLFSRQASYNPPLTREQAWGQSAGDLNGKVNANEQEMSLPVEPNVQEMNNQPSPAVNNETALEVLPSTTASGAGTP